jgi:hypothetical protein
MKHFRFLRPCSREVHQNLQASKKATYIQFYSAARKISDASPLTGSISSHGCIDRLRNCISGISERGLRHSSSLTPGDQKEQRIDELQAAEALKYPRIQNIKNAITCADFIKSYSFIEPNNSQDGEIITLRGMLVAVTD